MTASPDEYDHLTDPDEDRWIGPDGDEWIEPDEDRWIEPDEDRWIESEEREACVVCEGCFRLASTRGAVLWLVPRRWNETPGRAQARVGRALPFWITKVGLCYSCRRSRDMKAAGVAIFPALIVAWQIWTALLDRFATSAPLVGVVVATAAAVVAFFAVCITVGAAAERVLDRRRPSTAAERLRGSRCRDGIANWPDGAYVRREQLGRT